MTAVMAPAREIASGSRGTWRRTYARRLAVTDVLAVLTAVAVGSIALVPGTSGLVLAHGVGTGISYTVVAVLIAIAWQITLAVFASREPRIVGSGMTEYRRVAEATLVLFAVIAITAYVFGIDIGRAYLATAFVVGLIALVLSRWGWRQWLRRMQEHGHALAPVIVVGGLESDSTVHAITTFPGSGYRVVGVVSDHEPVFGEADRLGGLIDLEATVDRVGPEAVIVTSVSALGSERLQRLGWQLANRGSELIVAPGLAGIAGPRIHARPVADLPLLHVEYPELTGGKAAVKRLVDIAGALALIVVSAPVMAVVAVSVGMTSPGGILYRQERIGRGGRVFSMLKFRSMRADSDRQLAVLLREQGTSDRPLFKVQNDPRVTPVGRFIRRYSLDELPQFFNVLAGHMSLVGPRPQRAAEVALYEEFASRRHIVKPGISGLWQVSGRSTLAWEDAIRLDLSYVDNWSLTADVVILWRTMRAVLRPGVEAY